MNWTAKKIVSYVLAALIIVITATAILAIWDIISLEYVIKKVISSLLVIFASSVVTLFIFSVLIKDNK
jgi:hypothetical protein